MKAEEIRSWRTALRYLRHGDDKVARKRLALALSVMVLAWLVAAGCVTVAVLFALGILHHHAT